MNQSNSILGILGKKDSSNPPRNPRNRGRVKTQQSTDRKAHWLVDKFNSPEFLPVFRKVAWRLDDGTIDRLVAAAFEMGDNPRAYFIGSVKKEPAFYKNS